MTNYQVRQILEDYGSDSEEQDSDDSFEDPDYQLPGTSKSKEFQKPQDSKAKILNNEDTDSADIEEFLNRTTKRNVGDQREVQTDSSTFLDPIEVDSQETEFPASSLAIIAANNVANITAENVNWGPCVGNHKQICQTVSWNK